MSLPILDFMHPDKEENARKLVQMMKEIGFAYIDNVPGFDKEIEKDLLQASKWFFGLPLKNKMEVARRMYNKTSKQVYRGYFGLDRNYSSYKEGFGIGQDESTWPDYVEDPEEMKEGFPLTERNIWPQPDPDDSPEEQKHYNDFKRIMGSHFKEMMTASLELIELIAIGLGLPPSYYKDLFVPRSLSTLRPQHYPLRDFQAPPIAIEDGQVVICETHADNVFITLLATYHYTGLQVLLSDGSWLDVAPRPGSLVLNLGTFFAESTSWRLKATKHRVIETREDRYSLPFFLEPGFKAKIPRSLPGSSDSPMEYVQYGPFLIERSRKFAEFGDILELAKEVLNEK